MIVLILLYISIRIAKPQEIGLIQKIVKNKWGNSGQQKIKSAIIPKPGQTWT